MSFWLVGYAVDPAALKAQPYLVMPGDNDNDWSQATSLQHIKQGLRNVEEDMPPESVAWRAERIWRFVHQMQQEDIAAVHVKDQAGKPHLLFAEIIGNLEYVRNGELFEHRLPIRWLKEEASLLRLRSWRATFAKAGAWPEEIQQPGLTASLRQQLPLPGNRFRKWMWLLALAFIVQFIMVAIRMWQRSYGM